MKKNLKYIIPILIILLTLVALFIINVINKEEDTLTLLYEIVYNDAGDPGSTYEILIYSDRFEVNREQFCSALNCDPIKYKTKVFKYSKTNMKKLILFIENDLEVKKYESEQFSPQDLDEYEESVITSLLIDESAFEFMIK